MDAVHTRSVIPTRFQSLNKRWKEVIYALSGFGPNLMMVMMTAYFSDAILPTGFSDASKAQWWAIGGSELAIMVIPIAYSILSMIAKIFDGIIDIPFASLTDNFKSKYGRRRPLILLCFIPMVISYIACWLVPFNYADLGGQIGNTIWVFGFSLIFFATYTMCLIAFYGSLSHVCRDEPQRTRVSNYKAIFDTISYAVGYALLPVILQAVVDARIMNIAGLIVLSTPLMLTMLIPMAMIKEGDKYEKTLKDAGIDFIPLKEEERVSIWQSLKMTFTNKVFVKWLIVNCCGFFGLQLFLVSQNVIIGEVQGLEPVYATILNTAAFAPVPLMLFLFNRLRKKRGTRFAFQSCLLSFAVAILSFVLGSRYIWGDHMGPAGLDAGILATKLAFGIVGGLAGSWAIGAFFMMPLLIPSQVAAVEEKVTGKNHSAMYFAGQALATTVVGAISSQLIYNLIKDKTVEIANATQESTIKIGVLLVPIIVSIACIVGFGLCFLMPKNFDILSVAKGMKMEDRLPKEEFERLQEGDVAAQGVAGNIFLWFLSVGIYELFWRFNLTRSLFVQKENKSKIYILHYILSLLVFPYYSYMIYKMFGAIKEKYQENGLELHEKKMRISLIVSIIFTCLGLCFIANGIMQHYLNKIHDVKVVAHEEVLYQKN